MDAWHHVVPVDLDVGALGCPERDMEHRSVLRRVDPVTAEHRVDPIAQAGATSEREEERERLVGEPVLRVVEEDARRLGSHSLAPLGVGREQIAEVRVPDRLVMAPQGGPFGGVLDRFHGRYRAVTAGGSGSWVASVAGGGAGAG